MRRSEVLKLVIFSPPGNHGVYKEKLLFQKTMFPKNSGNGLVYEIFSESSRGAPNKRLKEGSFEFWSFIFSALVGV